jgi:patatin-like phospholipase/acyl hydrolase
MFRIVALDGGGIRGILSAALLDRLCSVVPGLLEGVGLYAGTSTGGILGLGLAAGLTPAALRDFYVREGPGVFDGSLVRTVGCGLALAKYSNERLAAALQATFGDRRLGALPGKVLIAAFDLDGFDKTANLRTWKPKFFHNLGGDDSDDDALVVDVALATSAAPTYFPSWKGFIDGGIVANNPSLAALAQALDQRVPAAARARGLADIALLSLGTGRFPRHLDRGAHDWGLIEWAKPLVEILLEGMEEVADFQCRQLLSQRYHRLDPVFGEEIAIDDAKKIPELLRIASDTSIDEILEWIGRVWTPAAAPSV